MDARAGGALSALALLLAAPQCGLAATTGNMNGRYVVASGSRLGVPFNDDYASKGHEFFDVWTPEIATHYAEVFWTDMGNQPLPDHIVKRFAGKAIAITGYEMDQVMVDPVGKPGVNPEKDVSVPINWAYNHHYMAWMTGRHSRLRKVSASPGDPMAHGASHKWIAEDRPSARLRADPTVPTSQMFSEGNGGESRKSFHGYPDGYAQLVDSPETWHITPMQIDTRNRDCGVTPADIGKCTKFTPGPEPRQARWGRGIPKEGTNYSGVLECPCNSRYGGDPLYYPNASSKVIAHNFVAVTSGVCAIESRIHDSAQCFAVAQTIGINASRFVNRTISDPKQPPGCAVVEEADGTASVNFNAGGEAPCTSGSLRSGESTTSRVNVTMSLVLNSTGMFVRSPPGQYCSKNRDALLRRFLPASKLMSDAVVARDACEAFCMSAEECWGCSVDCKQAYGVPLKDCGWNAISACGERRPWSGSIVGDVVFKNTSAGTATITVSGPAGAWFGVGLDATRMCDEPYALVVNDQGVLEQKLGTCGDEGCHCGGTQLKSSVSVVSNSVAAGVRTVVVERPLRGITRDHYSFDLSRAQTLRMITAVGHTQTFAHHRDHGPAEMTLTAVGTATCICDVGSTGQLCDTSGKCGNFIKNCAKAPAGDLFTQRNPTCNSKTYVGGLSCCGHKRIMLDVDQEVRPELLRYHMKFRFWFQEYSTQPDGKPSHYNLDRIYYQTESFAGEYDIPPAFALPGQPLLGYPGWPLNTPTPGTTCTGRCPDGPDCECVHTITYHWTVSNMRLVYAGGHCHAPSCISIELYRNDTGTPQLLCRQLPLYGQGRFPEDKWDEAGYVALPPCLWGDGQGLDPEQWLPKDTPLISIKRNRNTRQGHFGEMASWQMRGVRFQQEKRDFDFV